MCLHVVYMLCRLTNILKSTTHTAANAKKKKKRNRTKRNLVREQEG